MVGESNIFSIKALKTKYSKYGNNLERLFKNNSLDYLQKKLKNPKYFNPKDEKMDDLNSKNKNIININKLTMDLLGGGKGNKSKLSKSYLKKSSYFNNSKVKKFTLASKMELDNIAIGISNTKKKNKSSKKVQEEDEEEKELTFKELLQKVREAKIKRDKEIKNEAPDMWKYNPNYDIKFKNTPRIILPPLKIIKNSKKTSNQLESKSDRIIDDEEKEMSKLHTESEFNADSIIEYKDNKSEINKKDKEKEKDKSIDKEHDTSFNSFNKRIRAPNFEKYTARKGVDIPLTNNVDYMVFHTEV